MKLYLLDNLWRKRCGILRCPYGVWPYFYLLQVEESRVVPCILRSCREPIPHGLLGSEPRESVNGVPRHRSVRSRSEFLSCCACFSSEISSLFVIEQIELQAKLLNYFLGSNKSNINQSYSSVHHEFAGRGARRRVRRRHVPFGYLRVSSEFLWLTFFCSGRPDDAFVPWI